MGIVGCFRETPLLGWADFYLKSLFEAAPVCHIPKVCYVDPLVGLGTTSLEKMPIWSTFQNAETATVVEARIDNYLELVDDLKLSSDVQTACVVSAAYDRWGADCISKLKGAFALVLWNRSQNTLLLARDQLGEIPLYYLSQESCMFFSTSLPPLRTLLPISDVTNQLYIADFLLHQYERARYETPYQNLSLLPAGHILQVRGGERQLLQYFAFNPNPLVFSGSEEEYAEEYRFLLTQAVKRRLSRTGTTVILVSGGLDSSALALISDNLQKLGIHPAPIHGLGSRCPEWPDQDESRYQDLIAQHSGFPYTWLDTTSTWTFKEGEIDESFPLLLPEPHPQGAWIRAAMRYAKSINAHSVMHGEVADVVLGVSNGYGFPETLLDYPPSLISSELLWFLKYNGLGRVCYNLLGKPLIEKLLPSSLVSLLRLYRKFARVPWLEREKILRLQNGVNPPGFAEERMPLRSKRATKCRDWLLSGRASLLFQELYHHATGAEVSCTFPYADIDLVNFLLAVPTCYLNRKGGTKYLHRLALEDVLPHQIKNRQDSPAALKSVLVGLEREEKRLVRLLEEPMLPLKECLDNEAILQSLHQLVSGATADYQPVVDVCSYANWYRHDRNFMSARSSSEQQKTSGQETKQEEKKRYSSPVLVTHGSLAQLTHGGNPNRKNDTGGLSTGKFR